MQVLNSGYGLNDHLGTRKNLELLLFVDIINLPGHEELHFLEDEHLGLTEHISLWISPTL
jgi:hypothetical protein